MNIKCQVCGSSILYRRVNDTEQIIEIAKEDLVSVLTDTGGGFTEVYCKTDKTHEINAAIKHEVIMIALSFGY